MKRLPIIFSFLTLVSISTYAQREIEAEGFKLKQYYFVMLSAGPNKEKIDSLSLQKIQAGHLENIRKMAKEGKLAIAGPFGDDGDWRGIFIFDVDSEDEVRELLKNDPSIQAGRLSYEIHPWWTEKGSCLK